MSYNKENYDTLLKALEAIENNMWKICEIDVVDDDVHETIPHEYPFDKSLDEVVLAVHDWRVEVALRRDIKEKRFKPVGERITLYEWIYTGGDIWMVVGRLNDGTWFNATDFDNCGDSFQIFKTKQDAVDSFADAAIKEITVSNDKKTFVEMWKEILAHEQETNGTMSERVPDWKNQLIDMLANA